ncbi:hypothetical protein FACS1894163_01100 [Spirochaetia bacterium]|nr:hypothetical protein FACS1894163_01100 [Spirochaetia bacterium]
MVQLIEPGSLFTIGDGVTLVLDENIILKGISNNSAALVQVNEFGNLVMQKNARITGNSVSPTSHSNGGGVDVFFGTFIMNDTASVSGNTSSAHGSGGGGVHVNYGTFIMNGSASVSGNTTAAYSTYNGSSYAVHASSGGGVSVGHGTFIMNDNASVSGNTNTPTIINSSPYSGDGGGVSVGSSGTFIMNGSALVSGNTGGYSGGGVYVWDATFTMSGGTVYGSDGGSNANKLQGSGTKQGESLYKDSSATAEYGGGSPIIAGDQTAALYTDDTLTGH